MDDYDLGYQDGYEGLPERNIDGGDVCKRCYLTGYANGFADREEVQRSGSSNT